MFSGIWDSVVIVLTIDPTSRRAPFIVKEDLSPIWRSEHFNVCDVRVGRPVWKLQF